MCEKIVENIEHNLNLLCSVCTATLTVLTKYLSFDGGEGSFLGGWSENRGGDIVTGQIIV